MLIELGGPQMDTTRRPLAKGKSPKALSVRPFSVRLQTGHGKFEVRNVIRGWNPLELVPES